MIIICKYDLLRQVPYTNTVEIYSNGAMTLLDEHHLITAYYLNKANDTYIIGDAHEDLCDLVEEMGLV